MESTNGMALMHVGLAGRFAFNRTALRSSVNKQFEMRAPYNPYLLGNTPLETLSLAQIPMMMSILAKKDTESPNALQIAKKDTEKKVPRRPRHPPVESTNLLLKF
jgi:hypothetical protein